MGRSLICLPLHEMSVDTRRYICEANIGEGVVTSLADGISRLFVAEYGNDQYISTLQLQAEDKSIVTFRPQLQLLEPMFECPFLFLNQSESIIENGSSQCLSKAWLNIVHVDLLSREEWLEDASGAEMPSLGRPQSIQHSGRPGSAPSWAQAACKTDVGLMLTNKNGERLLIQANTLPYSISFAMAEEDIRNILFGMDVRTLYPIR